MATIEKGGPGGTRRQRSDLGESVLQLAEAAYADKGEWYSIDQPPDLDMGNLHTLVGRVIQSIVAEQSAKTGRIWIRFYKDADGSA